MQSTIQHDHHLLFSHYGPPPTSQLALQELDEFEISERDLGKLSKLKL